MQAAERELYAREYLFRPAKEKNTNTLFKMWGQTQANTIPVAQSVASRTRAAAEKLKKGQSRVDDLFMARMLVDTVKKEKRRK